MLHHISTLPSNSYSPILCHIMTLVSKCLKFPTSMKLTSGSYNILFVGQVLLRSCEGGTSKGAPKPQENARVQEPSLT